MIIDSETQVEFKRRKWTELPTVHLPPEILKIPKPNQIGFSYLSVSLDSNFGLTQILACSFYVITSVSEMAHEYFVLHPNLFQESPHGLFFFFF